VFDTSPSDIDALEEWLASPTIPTALDPIKYWVGMKAAGHPLAAMALDFLSVPGMWLYSMLVGLILTFSVTATSTDVERAFSRGGLTVSKLRHSLSDESTRCATVVGSWAKDDLVPVESVVTSFKEKARRNKKKAKTSSSTSVPDVIDVEAS
jgi:hypothetical protein